MNTPFIKCEFCWRHALVSFEPKDDNSIVYFCDIHYLLLLAYINSQTADKKVNG